MYNNPFIPATAQESKLRLAIEGSTGMGKTFTALRIAGFMLGGDATDGYGVSLPRRENGLGRVAFIDTERGAARKYSRHFPSDDPKLAFFDVLELERNQDGAIPPQRFLDAINAAADNGYEYLIIDSGSHAWEGVLDKKDKLDARGGNSYTNWRQVTPVHNRLVDSILDYPGHVIVCMRVKMERVMERDDSGKTVVRNVGLKAVMREGVEYEFDVVMDMVEGNRGVITKTRCFDLNEEQFEKPGEEIARILNAWLEHGEPMPMTRWEFVKKMNALGYETEAQIGQALKEHGLLDHSGPDKYEVMWEKMQTVANSSDGSQPVDDGSDTGEDNLAEEALAAALNGQGIDLFDEETE